MGTKLYIGTESGILTLEGGNGSWETTDSGLGDKFIEKLELTESGRLYTGLPRDGVYKSEGALDSWSRTLEADVRGLAVSPHDPSVVFAGTEPAGVFRSLDGGDSWEELTEVKKVPSYSNWSFPAPPFVAHVRTFSFVAGEPETVFAGVEVGGVLRSLDGGDTWEEYGEGIYEDVHYLLGNPGNPDIVYSTTGDGLLSFYGPGQDLALHFRRDQELLHPPGGGQAGQSAGGVHSGRQRSAPQLQPSHRRRGDNLPQQ